MIENFITEAFLDVETMIEWLITEANVKTMKLW